MLANDQILPGPNANDTIVSNQTNGVSGIVAINAAANRLLDRPAAALRCRQEPLIFCTNSVARDSANNSLLVLRNHYVLQPSINQEIESISSQRRANDWRLVSGVSAPNLHRWPGLASRG